MDLNYHNSCEDEDEDYISPNSPLYEYFEQQEFEKLQEDCYRDCSASKQSILNSILNGLKCVGTTFSDVCNVAVVAVYRTLCSYHNSVHSRTFKKVFNIVCEKKLLIPEDIVFIESFVPDTCIVEDQLIRLTIPVVSSCVLIGCFVYENRFEGDTLTSICKDSLILSIGKKFALFIISFSLSSSGWYFLLCCYHRFKCYRIQNKVSELCINLNCIVSTFKKSFRIVQEAEMIARGFTPSSAVGVAQRLELSTALPISSADRQLPEYRKLLFSWIKEIFMVHRNATVELIESWPISTDCMSHYFATLELKEFGNLLKYDIHHSEELIELLKVSDNLSISSLKSLHQLMEVQISEFLRRYCLSLLTDTDPEGVNYFATFEKLTGMYILLEKILAHHSKTSIAIKQAYSHYRSVQDSRRDSDPLPLKPTTTTTTTSPYHSFSLALQDLNAHLRATLLKAIAIEDYISDENSLSSGETVEEANELVANKLGEMLNDMKLEFSESGECISECSNLIEYMEKKSVLSNRKKDEPLNWQLLEKSVTESYQKVNFIGDSAPVIEDEVYEDITKGTDAKDESTVTDYDYSEKHKVDKVTTAHLMRELKTILVFKAEEHKEREQKALEAKALKERKLRENQPDVEFESLDAGSSKAMVSDHVKEESCHENYKSKSESNHADDLLVKTSHMYDKLTTEASHDDGQKTITKSAHNENDKSIAQSNIYDEPDEGDKSIAEPCHNVEDTHSSYHSEMHDEDVGNNIKERHIFCDIFQQKSHNFHAPNTINLAAENTPANSNVEAENDDSAYEENSLSSNVGLSTLFQQAPHSSFASSIAALASERQRKLNLQNLTYECDEDVIEEDC